MVQKGTEYPWVNSHLANVLLRSPSPGGVGSPLCCLIPAALGTIAAALVHSWFLSATIPVLRYSERPLCPTISGFSVTSVQNLIPWGLDFCYTFSALIHKLEFYPSAKTRNSKIPLEQDQCCVLSTPHSTRVRLTPTHTLLGPSYWEVPESQTPALWVI